MTSAYTVGGAVRCHVRFRDARQIVFDPATVLVTITDPAGNQALHTYGVGSEIVRGGKGRYFIDVPVDQPGRWSYYWRCTDGGRGAAENDFIVRAARGSTVIGG